MRRGGIGKAVGNNPVRMIGITGMGSRTAQDRYAEHAAHAAVMNLDRGNIRILRERGTGATAGQPSLASP